MADLINRQTAKEAIREKFKDIPSRFEINEVLNSLPSVQPERKRGKWRVREIHSVYGDGFELTCSECGNLFTVTKDAFPFERFCRNCGADMRGKQE